jgi:hypothetical protein
MWIEPIFFYTLCFIYFLDLCLRGGSGYNCPPLLIDEMDNKEEEIERELDE